MISSSKNTRIIICGHAQSGKTRIAKLCDAILGCTSQDSSAEMLGVVETFLALEHGLHYNSIEDMKSDKFNHRDKWCSAIREFCQENGLTAVADRIYSNHRIYIGPRTRDEYNAIREKYKPLSIWVSRDVETTPDMEVEWSDCDIVLDNNGDWSETVNRTLTILRRFNLDGSHEIGR